jgi:hypothetical protein
MVFFSFFGSYRQSADKFMMFVAFLSGGLEVPRFFQFRLVKNNTDFWTTDLMEDPVIKMLALFYG